MKAVDMEIDVAGSQAPCAKIGHLYREVWHLLCQASPGRDSIHSSPDIANGCSLEHNRNRPRYLLWRVELSRHQYVQ